MIYDAAGPEFRMAYEPPTEFPNLDASRFYSVLEVVKVPLWEGCVHLELSLVVRMLSIKSKRNQSQSSFDQWVTLIQPSSILKDYYQAKKLVSKLGLNQKRKIIVQLVVCCIIEMMLV